MKRWNWTTILALAAFGISCIACGSLFFSVMMAFLKFAGFSLSQFATVGIALLSYVLGAIMTFMVVLSGFWLAGIRADNFRNKN